MYGADEKLIDLLKTAPESWNGWRAENPSYAINLFQADLRGAKLAGAKLSEATLYQANLSGAELSGAELDRANLSGADLSAADLTKANIVSAELVRTSLSKANLTGVTAFHANFKMSNLEGADLSRADLKYADFAGANLSGADLSETQILAATFAQTKLHRTNFRRAAFGGTVLAWANLDEALNLETVQHLGPCFISTDTILLSRGKIPSGFLRGCGLDPLIQDLLSGSPESKTTAFYEWVSRSSPFQRCFISYATEDKCFADLLQQALNAAGVDYWYAPEHGRWGDSLQEQIDREIALRDRMLLVCSKTSLEKDWVSHEIDRAIDNEKKRGERIIFPIMLDDGLEKWQDPRKSRLWRVLAADFRSATEGDAFYKCMSRLLQALRAEKISLPPSC